jgi:hypothetical protein
MSGAALHAIFDLLAWLAAGLAAYELSRLRHIQFASQSFELRYIATLVFGAGLGAYLFGTLNLWLSGFDGIARSVEGASLAASSPSSSTNGEWASRSAPAPALR